MLTRCALSLTTHGARAALPALVTFPQRKRICGVLSPQRSWSTCEPESLPKGPGQIQLIMGPMFSGKTTEMLRRIRRHTFARQRCLIIKYAKDTRFSVDSLVTHDQTQHTALNCHTLDEISEDDLANVDVVGIDEGQFFPGLAGFADALANAGKVVIVSALDGTFQRKPFGEISDLVPLAEHVQKLTAVCMQCGASAPFSSRLGTETSVELIGGNESYMSTCRSCYLEHQRKQQKLGVSD